MKCQVGYFQQGHAGMINLWGQAIFWGLKKALKQPTPKEGVSSFMHVLCSLLNEAANPEFAYERAKIFLS